MIAGWIILPYCYHYMDWMIQEAPEKLNIEDL